MVLHVAINAITRLAHDYHMTITSPSYDHVCVCMYVCMYNPCIYSVFVFAQYKCMLTLHVGRQSEMVEKKLIVDTLTQESGASNTFQLPSWIDVSSFFLPSPYLLFFTTHTYHGLV